MIDIGTEVKWTSQAGGHTKEKAGIVVAILTDEHTPIKVAKAMFPNHRRMFDGLFIPLGYKRAYLVEVIVGPRARPRLYMPYPSKLKEV